MASSSWRMVSIEAEQRPDGICFDIFAVMEGPRGTSRFSIPPAALLVYREFQIILLTKFGVIFMDAHSEGRSVEAADEQWRTTCSIMIKCVASEPCPYPQGAN